MTLLLADFDATDKVLHGGYFDDVLGMEVSDVRFTSISGCVGACNLWSMRAYDLAQFRPEYQQKIGMLHEGESTSF